MRVISGKKRGLLLNTPPNDCHIRPTSDRVKESVFDLIQFEVDGIFLDLFCGTGQVGIEALSRGVDKAVFCDNSPQSVAITKLNLQKSAFLNYEVFLGDYKKYLKNTTERFKIIFIDPPYNTEYAKKALEVIGSRKILQSDGIVVVESGLDAVFPENQGKLQLSDKRKYGQTAIYIYKPFSEEEKP